MATSSTSQRDRAMNRKDPQETAGQLNPAQDMMDYFREYAREKPEVVALWCLGDRLRPRLEAEALVNALCPVAEYGSQPCRQAARCQRKQRGKPAMNFRSKPRPNCRRPVPSLRRSRLGAIPACTAIAAELVKPSTASSKRCTSIRSASTHPAPL
jgi:hypothetical protein